MKKRWLSLLLVLTMSLGISACGSANTAEGTDSAAAGESAKEETGSEGVLEVAEDPADWPVVKMEVISQTDTQEREAEIEGYQRSAGSVCLEILFQRERSGKE